jgi:hypothetical protein
MCWQLDKAPGFIHYVWEKILFKGDIRLMASPATASIDLLADHPRTVVVEGYVPQKV